MTKLGTLRGQLSSLRLWRKLVRWATGYSALATAILWAVVAIFVVDLFFFKVLSTALDVSQRLVLLSIAVAGCAVALYYVTLPFLGVKESETKMALMVERQHGIESDLVAALQFEGPAAQHWGSRQLEESVIDYVAQLGPGLDVFEGFNKSQLSRRAITLVVTLLVAAGLCGLFPGYASAFFNRLTLGNQHYPTRVTIGQVVINGQTVLVRDQDGTSPRDFNAAQGQSVEFTVHASGDDDSNRNVTLTSIGKEARGQTIVELSKQGDVYTGRLERLIDPVRFQVNIGDAWTDPARITMIPLPIVEPRMEVEPPKYAQSGWRDVVDPSARQLSVLEGSRIKLSIQCTNHKSLARAWATITTATNGGERISLEKTGTDTSEWTLPSKTPFDRITEEIRFEIQVTDTDGLQLASPILGFVRLKRDHGPTGNTRVVRSIYLPNASPVIDYSVSDDYGISQMLLHVALEKDHNSDAPEDADKVDVPLESQTILDSSHPILADDLPYEGKFTLNLSSLQLRGENGGVKPVVLTKGNRLKLTLEIFDYRGDTAGVAYRTEPLFLEIADVSDVFAANAKDDERADKSFEDIKNKILEP